MARKKLREEKLKNGLRVLLLEQRELPLVCSLLCYTVGSRDEGRGETGLSHFLEHMMFKGTRRLKRGEIDAITSRLGGQNNAWTGKDSTGYYFQVASDRWEKVLEIEADRMRGCLLDPKEFEREKKVVLEELRMGRDEPWRVLCQEVEAAAYQVHPYHHPIIGWEEDLVRLGREEMLRYYRRHYGPDRAVLVLCGDFDAASALESVKKYFERVPPTGSERPFAPAEPPQEGPRRVEVRAPGNLARLAVAWKGVRVADPEDPILDLAAVILGGGRASRLYKRLVKGEELAGSISVYNESHLDPGLFWVMVELKEGAPPERVERIVAQEVERLASRAPGKREMERARARVLTGLHFAMEGTYGRAVRYGEYAVEGNLQAMASYEGRVLRASAKDVMEAAARFLREPSKTTGWSFPAGKAGSPGQGGGSLSGAGALPGKRPGSLCFRRGGRRFPPVRRAVLDNGLRVLAVRMKGVPVVSLACSIDGGAEFETRPKAGLGNLAGSCLAEGTRKRSGEALAEAVESLGGDLASTSGGVGIRMGARDFTRALSILDEVVRTPSFPEDAVQRVKGVILTGILSDLEHPRTAAFLRFKEMIYGAHPLAFPNKGYPESVAGLTRKDLVEWHKRLFVPSRAILAVAGDIDPGKAVEEVGRRMGRWRDRKVRVPSLPPLERIPGRREAFLPMDREQVHIYLGHLGIPRNHPDYYALLVMDHILGKGPGFTDRISRRLRDELGLAYQVSAGITGSAHKFPGVFAAYIGTSPQNKDAALEGFVGEIEKIRRRPPSKEEISLVHQYLTGSFYLGLERTSQAARFLVNLERFDLGLDYLDRFPDLVRAQGPGEVLEAARRHLHPEDLCLVWAGPGGGERKKKRKEKKGGKGR